MRTLARITMGCIVPLLVCLTASAGNGTVVRYLSGHGCDDPVSWDFYCSAGANAGKWTRIGVPSCWETQGFGTFQYGMDIRRTVWSDAVAQEMGRYRYDFKVPSSWRDGHVFLVFEGVMTDTEVKVNGVSAGPVHRGAFYRFSYEIGSLLRFGGKNRLEVSVWKESADSTVNVSQRRGDYWNFGGIFRPVYLLYKPAAYIDRVAINAGADGSFQAECPTGNAPEGAVVKVTVRDRSGAAVAFGEAPAAAGRVHCHVQHPACWTAETPNLYEAEFALCDKAGTVLHRESQKFGFRTIEVRPLSGLYVNGTKVHVKGVNRHCFRPESGRTLSRRINEEDVRLIKSMNMNAVRCSHYPPDPDFLDICDSLGLYVIDEFNSWQKPMSTEAGRPLVREMVTRDVNHPCILWWSNGNEGGFNFELEPEFHRYDPQLRPVLYPWLNRNGFETKHYNTFGGTQEYMRGPELYMPTEFLHGLYDGGHGAGLEDYWNEMMANPRCVGGFLWSLADEGVLRRDKRDSLDCRGDYAPDGIVGPHGEKEGSYYTIRQIWSPVQVSYDGKNLIAENRYDYLSLSGCRFTVDCLRYKGMDETVICSFSTEGPDVAPGERGILPVPGIPDETEVLRVGVMDPYGCDLFTWTFVLSRPAVAFEASDVTFAEKAGTMTIQAGDCEWTFDGTTGRLLGARKAGAAVSLSNGPRFFALRRMDRTPDGETLLPDKKKAPEHTGYDFVPDPCVLDTMLWEGKEWVVKYACGALEEVRWTFSKDGRARLDYRYRFNGLVDMMGVAFDYPESGVHAKQWLGNGPYRVWQNRLKGPQMGVWQVDYNNAIPGVDYAYPEFKGFFSGVRHIALTTEEGVVAFDVPEGKYLGVYTPEDGPTHNLFVLPQTGLSFLDVIPAIRTKFHASETLGPSSRPVYASGAYGGTIIISL